MKLALIAGAFLCTSFATVLSAMVLGQFFVGAISGFRDLVEALAAGVAITLRGLPFWALIVLPIFAGLRAIAAWKTKEGALVFAVIGFVMALIALLPIGFLSALAQTRLGWPVTFAVLAGGAVAGALQWWLEQKWFVIEPRLI